MKVLWCFVDRWSRKKNVKIFHRINNKYNNPTSSSLNARLSHYSTRRDENKRSRLKMMTFMSALSSRSAYASTSVKSRRPEQKNKLSIPTATKAFFNTDKISEDMKEVLSSFTNKMKGFERASVQSPTTNIQRTEMRRGTGAVSYTHLTLPTICSV